MSDDDRVDGGSPAGDEANGDTDGSPPGDRDDGPTDHGMGGGTFGDETDDHPVDTTNPYDDEGPFADLDAGDGDPFAELDAGEDGLGEDADPFGDDVDAADRFSPVDVGEVNEEGLWEKLDDPAGEAVVEIDPDEVPDVDTAAEEFIVPKASYCENCEYFSTPPETSCGHPGTEIRELVDVDHFRVANCPVVVRRRTMGYIED